MFPFLVPLSLGPKPDFIVNNENQCRMTGLTQCIGRINVSQRVIGDTQILPLLFVYNYYKAVIHVFFLSSY